MLPRVHVSVSAFHAAVQNSAGMLMFYVTVIYIFHLSLISSVVALQNEIKPVLMVWLGDAMAGVLDLCLKVTSSVPSHSAFECDLGQVIRTDLHLLPSSIIWCQLKLGSK